MAKFNALILLFYYNKDQAAKIFIFLHFELFLIYRGYQDVPGVLL